MSDNPYLSTFTDHELMVLHEESVELMRGSEWLTDEQLAPTAAAACKLMFPNIIPAEASIGGAMMLSVIAEARIEYMNRARDRAVMV